MVSMNTTAEFDIVIIGGGPAGSTCGSLLRKYNPELSVCILERERFPREHVGESLLPPCTKIVYEMGAWDEIEASGFPIKLGATYTWGKTTDPWVFNFVSDDEQPERVTRPGAYEGWRERASLQVDRAIYDDVLLRNAEKLGCDVRQETAVKKVLKNGDRIEGLELSTGETIRARRYIDASGNAAIVRKAMGVGLTVPTLLKNVAFWNYWENPAWAGDPEAEATRVHIRSIGFGWLWHIRLGPTRTSVGLVCNAEYYKKAGLRPAELYAKAIESEPLNRERLKDATPEGEVIGTTDWSFVVDRTVGENWFLVGECAGFADPILAAGMTLTQSGARELAYTILELERGEHDAQWLTTRFDELQRRRVIQHMKFAEFWYSTNGIFEDIQENCTKIASEAGLKLNPADAFRWLSQGGLDDDIPGLVGIGGHDLASLKQILARLTGKDAKWSIDGRNTFKLNLSNAKKGDTAQLRDGRIERTPCWIRGNQRLMKIGLQGAVIEALEQSSHIESIMAHVRQRVAHSASDMDIASIDYHVAQILEVLANDYWVTCSTNRKKPVLNISTPMEGKKIFTASLGPAQTV